MLIEFLRSAVNLTPSLKSLSIPQTPTHRLPAKAKRSYDESPATGAYEGMVMGLRVSCRRIDIRFPVQAKDIFHPASYPMGKRCYSQRVRLAIA